jgi:hypothetical protein
MKTGVALARLRLDDAHDREEQEQDDHRGCGVVLRTSRAASGWRGARNAVGRHAPQRSRNHASTREQCRYAPGGDAHLAARRSRCADRHAKSHLGFWLYPASKASRLDPIEALPLRVIAGVRPPPPTRVQAAFSRLLDGA